MTAVWILVIVVVAFLAFRLGMWSMVFFIRTKVDDSAAEMERYIDSLDSVQSNDYVIGALDAVQKFVDVMGQSLGK